MHPIEAALVAMTAVVLLWDAPRRIIDAIQAKRERARLYRAHQAFPRALPTKGAQRLWRRG